MNFLVILSLGLGMVGIASSPGWYAAKAVTVDAVKKEGKEEKPKTETVRGILRHATTNEVTIDVAGKTMAVKLSAESRFTIKGREGAASELKVGQEVRCTHIRRDAERICQEIVVLEEKK